jgi:hypothetical protein
MAYLNVIEVIHEINFISEPRLNGLGEQAGKTKHKGDLYEGYQTGW